MWIKHCHLCTWNNGQSPFNKLLPVHLNSVNYFLKNVQQKFESTSLLWTMCINIYKVLVITLLTGSFHLWRIEDQRVLFCSSPFISVDWKPLRIKFTVWKIRKSWLFILFCISRLKPLLREEICNSWWGKLLFCFSREGIHGCHEPQKMVSKPLDSQMFCDQIWQL